MKTRIMQRSGVTDIAPVNKEDYIISLQGIELLVFKLKSKLPKARVVYKRGKIMEKLHRLAAIQTDLRKALEL